MPSSLPDMPPWKHRRRLVYASWALGAVMIVVAMFALTTDFAVATQLIVGGVAIITIPLGAYVSWAAYEDTRLWPGRQDKGDPYE